MELEQGFRRCLPDKIAVDEPSVMDPRTHPLEETPAKAAESISDALDFLRGEADAAGLPDVSELIREASARSRQHSIRLSSAEGVDAPPNPAVVRVRSRRRLYVPLAAAASAAVIALAFLLSSTPVYEASYRTAVGEHQEIVLPDDSVLMLNTDSAVTVRYSDDRREIHLERGEAHFEVTPAPARPFRVAAGRGTVRAIGTAFNVHLDDGTVEVLVEEGVVEVETSDSRAVPPQILEEGQTLEYRETLGAVSTVGDDEIARRLAWHDGMLDFRGNTLAEVIEVAGRHTSTRITIVDPALESLSVTGYIRAGDVDTLLQLLTSEDRISVRRIGAEEVQIMAANTLGAQ